ncbi:VWA domain-containing protein [Paracrocinitomix mangrovi]|uniref:vWA domain-containing protein n=1 Tax=Paracrocinitomix mangrovi TaxID=2862509 RepID=UPI001C8D600E|nr:VWA domain-containing protein [Paracrocinitomix mangrovi]UKN03544.1 VWA domain-containing protein [Paracrocinitomix mangrovi]
MKTRNLKIAAVATMIVQLTACGGGEGSSYEDLGQSENYNKVAYTEEEAGEIVENYDMDMMMEDDIAQIEFNTEEYAYMPENEFLSPGSNPLSTFSIDVDNASYTNVRRFIEDGVKPPVDAVRTEEFINYFDYDYPVPTKDETFSVYTEVGDCPWNKKNRLVHIGLKGYTVDVEDLPPSNLVFLIDVSGSMEDHNKLPLLKKSYKLLVDKLNAKDRVSIVTYAGDERVVLESTSCEHKDEIKEAIDNLTSGGSTNGAGGIEKAYEIAVDNLLEDGNNRVILATDGDFNIGRSSDGELTRLIEEKRDQGVFLTILGFGMGNYKDSKMESLADHGNGNYFYIDDIRESNRVLVTNLAGTLLTIAKDVKIQVEFNPDLVKEYRLIGYENRVMNNEDFDNDKKDAGELGAGHTVTAIYEIVPGKADKSNLKYQQSQSSKSDELVWVKLRYKKPKGSKSKLIEMPVKDKGLQWEENSESFKFSVAVAGFSLILRESQYINDFDMDDVSDMLKEIVKIDDLQKVEFLQLVEQAKLIPEAS